MSKRDKLSKNQGPLVQYVDSVEFAKAAARNEWVLACAFDKVDPDALFVVFSDANPHVARHSELMAAYLEAARKAQGR